MSNNFVPKENNNGQSIGRSDKSWTAGYVATVPENDSAMVNKKYFAPYMTTMQPVNIDGTELVLDVEENIAYHCNSPLTSLTINSMPESGNFKESIIWFTADEEGCSLIIEGDYYMINSLSIIAGNSYVISIQNRTLTIGLLNYTTLYDPYLMLYMDIESYRVGNTITVNYNNETISLVNPGIFTCSYNWLGKVTYNDINYDFCVHCVNEDYLSTLVLDNVELIITIENSDGSYDCYYNIININQNAKICFNGQNVDYPSDATAEEDEINEELRGITIDPGSEYSIRSAIASIYNYSISNDTDGYLCFYNSLNSSITYINTEDYPETAEIGKPLLITYTDIGWANTNKTITFNTGDTDIDIAVRADITSDGNLAIDVDSNNVNDTDMMYTKSQWMEYTNLTVSDRLLGSTDPIHPSLFISVDDFNSSSYICINPDQYGEEKGFEDPTADKIDETSCDKVEKGGYHISARIEYSKDSGYSSFTLTDYSTGNTWIMAGADFSSENSHKMFFFQTNSLTGYYTELTNCTTFNGYSGWIGFRIKETGEIILYDDIKDSFGTDSELTWADKDIDRIYLSNNTYSDDPDLKLMWNQDDTVLMWDEDDTKLMWR